MGISADGFLRRLRERHQETAEAGRNPADSKELSSTAGWLSDGPFSEPCHFLSHVQEELAVAFVHFAKQPPELVQKTSFLSAGSKRDLVRGLAPEQVGKLRGFFAVVKELIERDLEGAGHLFERFDGRNGMAIFDARNVTAQQPGAFLDVPL